MTSRRTRLSSLVAADLEAQNAALDIPCPYCAVPAEERCVNPLTDHTPLKAAHWQRVKAAQPTTTGDNP
jgi:hypothetical protein